MEQQIQQTARLVVEMALAVVATIALCFMEEEMGSGNLDVKDILGLDQTDER